MKRTGKILSLLLIAVMLLTLLPVAAFADPPVGDTHRHNWVVTSYKKATCTENGKRTWKCTLCGQTYSETYRALGHKWDEGTVTTEPHGFTPGVRTYTCKNDPSHTYTEEIGALEYLFPWLNGESFSTMTPYGPAPLVITEQPQGGSITRYEGESHTMHVTASGGAGGYTYEWFSGTQDTGKKEGNNDLLKWFVGLFGVSAEEVDQVLNTPLSKTDTLTTETGNDYYYCVVKDKAGTEVTSEKARVSYKIRIAKQPDNVNLQIENPTLFCEAVDGSLDYTYRWFDHDEGFLGEGQSYPIDKEGYYYCVVTDNVTGETVQSEYSDVYSTPPFRLVQITPDFSIAPNQQETITASFADGLEPYEIWWKKDGVAVDSVEEPVGGHPGSHLQTSGPGEYTVYAVDSHYETIQATCIVTEEKLTVVQQPSGAKIPNGGHADISVTVSGGKGPYTFYLYNNGVLIAIEIEESGTASRPLYYPGNYYYHIEDSEGRSVDSDSAYFEDGGKLHIKSQTESESITEPDGKVLLSVEAEGGSGSYSYQWLRKIWGKWYKTGKDQSTYEASGVSEYVCLVTDSQNRYVFSEVIPVNYTGGAPWILLHPSNKVIEPGEPHPEMFCSAIVAEGHGIRYEWYEKRTTSVLDWDLRAYDTMFFTPPRPGLYRCRVVDTTTNGWTWSEIAVASEKLSVSLDLLSPDHPYDMDCRLEATIKGGIGPYIVKVFYDYRYEEIISESRIRYTTVFKLYNSEYKERRGLYWTYVPRYITPGETEQQIGNATLVMPMEGYLVRVIDKTTGEIAESVPLKCPMTVPVD